MCFLHKKYRETDILYNGTYFIILECMILISRNSFYISHILIEKLD